MLISTCYKPATTHRAAKIVATSHNHGWRSLAYDPALSASDNHLAAANKLAHALGGSVSYDEYGQTIEGRDEATFHLVIAGKAERPDGVPPSAMKLRDKRSDAVAYVWRDTDWQTLILFGDEEHARHCGGDEATIDRLIRHAFERRQGGAEARLLEARNEDEQSVTIHPSIPANDNDSDPDGGGSSALPPQTPIQILAGAVEYALAQSQAFNGAREALAMLQAQLALPQGGSSPVQPATRPRGRKGGMTAEQFFDAYQTARMGVSAAIGERWVALGFGRWATVPTGLRSFKGARGGKVTLPRDIRVPPMEYWPGGTWPEGLLLAETITTLTPWVLRNVPGHDKPVATHPMLANLMDAHAEQRQIDAEHRRAQERPNHIKMAKARHARALDNVRMNWKFRDDAAGGVAYLDEAASIRRELTADLQRYRETGSFAEPVDELAEAA